MWRPSLPETVAILAFGALIASGPDFIGDDGDTLTHAVIGKDILANGWPSTDPLLAPEVSVQLHEWGYEVLLAAAGSIFGNAGYVLVGASFIALAVGLVMRRMVDRAGAWPALFLLALALPSLLIHLHARPHVVSWCAIVLLVLLLDHAREHEPTPRFVVLAAALGIAWANLHGGFLIAPFVWASFAVDSLRRPSRGLWIAGGLAFGIGTFVNPEGPWLHAHLIDFISDSEALAPIGDLVSVDLLSRPGLLLIAWTVVALIALRRGPASHLVLTIVLALLTWRLLRNAPLFVLATAPLIATNRGPSEIDESSTRVEALFNQTSTGRWPLVLGIVALATAPLWSPRLPADTLPVAALDAHQANDLDGPGLVMFRWGGVTVHERPDARVFIHPLNALYPRERQRDYARLTDGDLTPLPDEVTWSIVDPNTPIHDALDRAGWHTLHQDPIAVLLTREPAS